MNLNRLRVFDTVARLQSFSRASKALYLTQPGISKHIKQLEEYYGTRLFDRLGKRVALTQAGEILFQTTQIMFKLVDESKLKIDDLKEMTGGKISIGASFTAGIYFVPAIISRFNRCYPKVDIHMDIYLSQCIAEKVLANELDIGFIGAPYDDDRLVIKTLREDKLMLIIPSDHLWKDRKAIRLSELVDQPLILSNKGSGTRTVVEKRLAQANVRIENRIEFGNTEAVKKAVSAGLGISILSEAAVQNDAALGRIKTINILDRGRPLKRTFYYTLRKEKYRTYATRALIDLL
jgi:DNA-binding transcriptional LysR family regulator